MSDFAVSGDVMSFSIVDFTDVYGQFASIFSVEVFSFQW